MANEATGHGADETGLEAGRSEESGRFPIPMSSQPILPPPGPVDGAEEPAPLDAELETVLIDATPAPAAERPKTVPPPVPPVSVRPASIRPPSARPVQSVTIQSVPTATQAQYSGLKVSDRADLRVDDLSLDIDHNPYTRSSLVPPPRQALPVGAWLSGAAVGASVAVAVMLVLQPRGSAGAPVAQAPAVVAAAAVSMPGAVPAPAARPSTVPAPVAPAPDFAPTTPTPVAAPAAPVVQASVEQPAPATPPAPAPEIKAQAPKTEAVKPSPAVTAAPATEAGPQVVETAKPAPDVTPEAVPAAVAPADANAVTTVAVAAPSESTTVAPTEASPTEGAPSELPETLSREDVMAGFEKLRADITACAAGGHGQVAAKATIAGSGRVTYAVIEGAFAGTPEGSCMALVVRKATFPSFASATLKVTYPFAL